MGNVCTNYCCCCFKQERLEQNARCTKICWCCCKQNIEPQNENIEPQNEGPVDANQVLVMSAQSASFPVNVNINELDEMSRELQQLSKSKNLKLANGVETNISTTAPPSAKLNSLIQLAATWSNLFDVNIAVPANQIGKDELMKTFSTEVARIFSYVGSLHWACAGLALIAFAINEFDQMNKNHQQCCDLLHTLVRFWQSFIRPLLDHEGDLIEKSVNQGIQVILECVLFCTQFLHKGRPARFIFVDSHKNALHELKEKLKEARDEIDHTLLFEVHSKHHQKPTQRTKSSTFTVGLTEQSKEVLQLLNLENRDTIQAVVLHGMGGVGKSTLASSVYDNEIRWIGGMACSCIRLRQGFSVAELQKQMIKDLLPEENCSSVKVEELWQALGNDQRRHPVFIYIDNILEMKDLEDLLPKYMEQVQLPRGSRLMLTTRDLNVCTKVLGRNKSIVIRKHAVKCLEPKEGKELLKACAFGIPLEEHIQHEGANEQAISEELIEQIVKACGGLPLAITVLGKQLFGADDGEWERALEKLHRPTSQNIAEDQVFKVLQYSYDALDVDCQKAFVLVSSFLDAFRLWTWASINHFVESVCPGITMETLVNYSLVEPSQFYDEDSGKYNLTTKMHDLLLSLGIQIAKQKNIITKRVQDESDFQEMVPEKWCDVQWLMVDENIEGGFPAHLLDKCERLEILLLGSPLRGHLEKVPTTLKVLILARIEEDDIWWNSLASLENLVYFCAGEGCSIFPAFSQQIRIVIGFENEIFPNKLVSCSRLRKLHCLSFPQFPPGFCQSMTHLRSLALNLAESEEEPRSARADDEIECPSLPQDLGRLNNLLSLYIISRELRVLPESLVELRRLRVLDLRNCNKLKQLPPNFGSGLKALIYLRIESLQMTTLPEDMGNLKELQYLELELPSLEALPPTFTQLPNLLDFRLTASSPLKLLGGLEGQITSLESLTFQCCNTNLSTIIPVTHLLHSLQKLGIIGFPMVELPPGIGELRSLKVLYVMDAPLLQTLPVELALLPSLELMVLEKCPMLTTLVQLQEGQQNITQETGNISSLFSSLNSLLVAQCPSFQLHSINSLPHHLIKIYQNLPQSIKSFLMNTFHSPQLSMLAYTLC